MNMTLVSPEIQSLIDERLVEANLNQVIEVIGIHNQKEKFNPLGGCGKLLKVSDPIKLAVGEKRGKSVDYVLKLNEDIFNRLDEFEQIIILDKLIAQIEFDFERGTTSIAQPDIQDFKSIRAKYPHDTLEAIELHLQSLYEEAKEREQEEKENKKGKRGRPKKN